ncbi:MAG: sigma 54-interacting transcriptional regulator [Woeseiaceae bacterium]|nr:sigma 54-interacting transcriptional regulator [Woeseiaceae bacterium]
MTRAVAVLLLLAAALQTEAGDPRSMRFQHVSQEQGLSQSYVYAIVQDSTGYMWFGTQNGLNRFDGIDFEVFANDPNDPASLSDETVRTILRDSSGDLWIGTDAGGLSRFDRSTRTFTNYLHAPENPGSIGSNSVRVVFEDSKGVLWIGTDGAGLDRFDRETGTFAHYVHDPSDTDTLASNRVWSIVEGRYGSIWIATDSGLSRLMRGSGAFTHYRHDPDDPGSISDNQVRVLYRDGDDTIWAGTGNGGLNRFDYDTGTFERFVHDPEDNGSISANRVNTIYEDRAGVLWVGTVQGLNAWEPRTQTFERYVNDSGDRYSLSHDNVLSIFQDMGGVLWVGTYAGLSRWIPATRAMLHYREDANDPRSLNASAITSFAEDESGRIWVGTFGGGINVLDLATDRFRHINHVPGDESSLSSDRVMSLEIDSSGIVWAGTRAAGLNRYDSATESFTHFRSDPDDSASLSADGVTYILESADKTLWVATFGGGLNKFDSETGTFRRFRHDPDDPRSLSSDRILALFEDRAGDIWIGTYGGGLNRFDPRSETFTRFGAETGRRGTLSGDEITMIQEGRTGDLWVGVKDGGLHRWRHEDRTTGTLNFERFTELDGLPDATIYAGSWDKHGNLWMSTDRGLSRLDTETLRFRNYDMSHGLQGDEYNLAAAYSAADGRLYFGGLNGFNAFDPALLDASRDPPVVVIKSVSSMNEAIDVMAGDSAGKALQLAHDQRVISFEFAALDFAAPEKNAYRYRLDGFDADWVDAGRERRATYTNLPAGAYTFRVMAANNDGVWSERDAVLPFRMMPAPWATWWAYLTYAILAGLLARAILAHHARRSREMARLAYAEQLALAHDRMNEAQQIAKIGNWDWDLTSNDIWCSPEIYRLFAAQQDSDTIDKEFVLAHLHPDDVDRAREAVRRSLDGGVPLELDHRIVTEDGSERTVCSRATVTLDDAGRAVRLAGTVHDITNRKATENEIRRRADFHELLATLSSSLVMVKPDDFGRQIEKSLESIGRRYELDRAEIWWCIDDRRAISSLHSWPRTAGEAGENRKALSEVPWLAEELWKRKTVAIDDVGSLPEDAASSVEFLARHGTRSLIIVPFQAEKKLAGTCVFSSTRTKGAWSSATKGELTLLADTLMGAISRAKAAAKIVSLQNENLQLREHVRLSHGFEEIVGEDPKLKDCLAEVEKVAPTNVAVLVLGETGTGKELIARAIHRLSDRNTRPLVKVNCPALPANLIESELFGHEKGAFTGAHSRRLGRFEVADGGTLFLDEIADLPLALQSKLLRVLQTGDFERLGGTETLHCDVRVVAATNRELAEMVETGAFRADLYYRISSFPIRLPALRDRRDDILLLTEHFIHKHGDRLGKSFTAISAKMLAELMRHSWPGNVRELESVVERAMICDGGSTVLELPGPPQLLASMHPTAASGPEPENTSLDAFERAHISSVLRDCGWRISGKRGAAEVLGMPPSTLRSKMKRLGVTRGSI